MKLLCAGLTAVCVATLSGLAFGFAFHGIGATSSLWSLIFGAIGGIAAGLMTVDREPIAQTSPARARSARMWTIFVGVVFALFALRSFIWVLYQDGDKLRVQSPNNIGDLALHVTYIRYLANGASFWPDNPILTGTELRYPVGTDLFNALLECVHIDLIRALIWCGLLSSAATFYAFYRWGGPFAVAGFLFNGGVAGWAFFKSHEFLDYQGGPAIAWKSIALSMLVTQRGVLYAFPVGVLLLYQWREKLFLRPARGETAEGPLPFWVEVLLYASMPLFHAHTFMALSMLLGAWLVIGTPAGRGLIVRLIAWSLLPAGFLAACITNHFTAASAVRWWPGWVQLHGGFAMPFLDFWLINFGLTIPLVLLLVARISERAWKDRSRYPIAAAFVLPACGIFLFACLVGTTPWDWDNIKLLVWGYFIVLPFLWSEVISPWPELVRIAVCIALFFSGFITLFGGMGAGQPGYAFAERFDVAGVQSALRDVPIDRRFVAAPAHNHPVLLAGRKVVMGHEGHVWTQGFPGYFEKLRVVELIMNGTPQWLEHARAEGARYLFWGSNEQRMYPRSIRPWEKTFAVVDKGTWGAIYDLEKPMTASE